jgi:hypothetical protein
VKFGWHPQVDPTTEPTPLFTCVFLRLFGVELVLILAIAPAVPRHGIRAVELLPGGGSAPTDELAYL